MSKREIRDLAQQIGIPYLVHFTHIENLESIIEMGLLSRQRVDGLSINAVTNDEERLDGRENTISLSIAHPNDLMFYKYRNNDEDWIVVVLNPKILWELDCLFLKNNAADSRMSRLSDDQLSTVHAFKAMFEEADDLDSREAQCLEAFDPTDKQAEVLVLNEIPTKYILGFVVASRQVKKDCSDILDGWQVKIHTSNKGFFSTRLYRRKWQ